MSSSQELNLDVCTTKWHTCCCKGCDGKGTFSSGVNIQLSNSVSADSALIPHSVASSVAMNLINDSYHTADLWKLSPGSSSNCRSNLFLSYFYIFLLYHFLDVSLMCSEALLYFHNFKKLLSTKWTGSPLTPMTFQEVYIFLISIIKAILTTSYRKIMG